MKMKILKYTKTKKNQYTLELDNDTKITLFDDTILKYELLLTKEITNLDLILKENKKIESYYFLLKRLNQKMLSVKQAEEYLIKNGYNDLSIIKRLEKEGYLSDERYLISYINDQVNLKLVGPNKIKQDLIKLGMNSENIDKYLITFSEDVWFTKINKYLTKKIKANKKYSIPKLKQKLMIDLINKGFYKEQIDLSFEQIDFSSDEEILKKDFRKTKSLLEKKYSNKELDLKLKQKLLAKGYKLSQINQLISDNKEY